MKKIGTKREREDIIRWFDELKTWKDNLSKTNGWLPKEAEECHRNFKKSLNTQHPSH